MIKYLTNNFYVIDLHKNPSKKSEIVTQMIYGDSFSISKKSKKWLKIKIKEDGYIGFIKSKKFPEFLKPTHKVHVLKSQVFKNSNKIKKINKLPFGSKLKIIARKRNLFKFFICKTSKFNYLCHLIKKRLVQKNLIFFIFEFF